MDTNIEKKDSNDLNINERLEELKKWKNEIENKLSQNIFRKEQLFIVSKYWFDKYEKIILGIKNESKDLTEFNEEIKENNNELFSSFIEKIIKIEELPKIYIINKDIWANIKIEYKDLSTILVEGIFSNELLTMKVLNLIYCFIFLDKKGKLRQGYIKIYNKDEENKIMEKFREKGVFNFLKEHEMTINDEILKKETTHYKIYIFKNFVQVKEKDNLSEDEDEDEKIIIEKRKTLTYRRSAILAKTKDEFNCFFGTKIFNVKKVGRIDLKEKMGEIGKMFKKLFKAINAQKNIENKKIEKNKNDSNDKLRKDLTESSENDAKSILPEKRNELKYKPGIIGLQNIGATCYMNATLQCFSNIKRFRMDLLKIYQILEKDKNTKKLSFALAEVFQNLWVNLENGVYPPNNFKDIIGDMNPLFRGIAANDPKDLIIFLLETIHKELNNPPKKEENNYNMVNSCNFSEVFNDFIQGFTNNNNSLVCEEFYGCSNSMTTCAKCQTTIHNVQALNILFFPLEEVRKFVNSQNNSVKIEDCFLYYEKQEIFPSFYCNYCEQLFPAFNQYKLIYTPPTLIINLNRGRGLQFNVGIEFEEKLDIRNYVYAEDSPSYYELVGVMCHLGSNDMGGHFIAFCRDDNCEWYKYNDAFVTKSSFNEIKQCGIPYVLFYSFIQI